MHVIDLVDNCGMHEASRPTGMPALLSGQAIFAVVVAPAALMAVVVVFVVVLFLRTSLTHSLV